MTENITRLRKPDYLMVVSDVNGLNQAAVNEIALVAEAATREHGRVAIALSGGNTPRGVYSLLAEQQKDKFPWAKAFFFFGDERSVPPDHADSNYRMANESLFSKVAIPAANIFRIHAELGAAKAAEQYESMLKDFFKPKAGDLPRFDLVLLGLGDEGHTASLFPDSTALQENARLVVANRVDKLNTDRITFTFPLINAAGEAMFLVSGPGKTDIVKEIFLSDKEVLPAQRVHPPNGRLLWIVDQAAARLL